jgi:hypothetical protein
MQIFVLVRSEIDHQPLHKISFGFDGRYPERNLAIVIR